MKKLKYLYYIFYILIFLILFVFIGAFLFLNSQKALDFAAKRGIDKLHLDLKYKNLKGDFFSGIAIKEFNYQNKVKGDLYLKADWSALKNRNLKIQEVNLTSLWIDENFLKNLLKNNKQAKKEQNKSSNNFLKSVEIDNLNFSIKNFKWDRYKIDNLLLNVKDFKYDMNKTLSCVFSLKENGNTAFIHLLGRVNLPNYRFSMDGEVKRDFINNFIKNNEIYLKDNVSVYLKGKGDLDKIYISLNIKPFGAKIKDIDLKSKKATLKGDFGIKSHILDAKLLYAIDSNLAKLNLNAKTALDIDDINNTLTLNALSDVKIKSSYLKTVLGDKNITVLKEPKFRLNLNGNMKNLSFDINGKDIELRAYGINVFEKKLSLKSNLNALKGDFNANLNSSFDSKLGGLFLESFSSGNLNDLNNTLKFRAKTLLTLNKKRIKNKDLSILISKNGFLEAKVFGDMKKIKAKVLSDLDAKLNGKKVRVKIENTDFSYSLLDKKTKGIFNFDLDSYFAKGKGNIEFFANLNDLNSTLTQSANIKIERLTGVKDINLTPLMPLKISSKGKLSKFKAKISSSKFYLLVKSLDLNRFNYSLKTRDLNISKIYKPLSDEIILKLNSRGYYKIAAKEGKIESKIEKFIFNKNKFYTDTFVAGVSGEDFYLDRFKVYGDGFWVSLFAKKSGKNIKLSLFSPKIVLPKGKIEDIELKIEGKGDKKEGVLKVKKAGFRLRDFKPKEMNREISLKKEGLIEWKGEDGKIDLDFGDDLKFYAVKIKDDIKEKIKIKRLYLAYEDFGHSTVFAKVNISKRKEKISVKGDINFYDTLINYKPKFLSISEDSDVIIITKKDKNKKKKKENKDFIKNVSIDLKIKSKDEMIYKTDEAFVSFKPDLKIEKEFNKSLKLLGKINIINGYYDLADKRFLIQKGAIAFRGQKQINPLLDLHIKYDEIEDVIIFIDIRGDVKKPRLSFKSTPPMPKKDILSYLSFGMSTRELKGIGSNAKGMAEKIFSKAVSKDLAKELNLDTLSLMRNSEGGFNIKAGKKINKKTIIYYQNKNTQNKFIYERKLNDRWKMNLSVGEETGKEGVGVVGEGIDLFYERSFK